MNLDMDSSSVLSYSICNDTTCPTTVRKWLPSVLGNCSDENPPGSADADLATFDVTAGEDGVFNMPTKLTNLIRLVTRLKAPHTFILENASFATSRPCIQNYLDLAHFYPLARTAALLVMQRARSDISESLITNDLAERATVKESLGDVTESSRSTPEYEKGYSVSTTSLESPRSPPRVRYSWEPVDNVDSESQYSLFAHYREYPESFPIACIAEQSVIVSLLRSAVYQRLAWGVQDPVVGLGFSPGSSVVQTFVAWPTMTWREGLPLVAIASDQSEYHTPAAGWFDLTLPAANIAFVRYLSKVTELAAHPARRDYSGKTRWLEWRFDFANYDKVEDTTMDKMASVQAWAKEAMSADAGESSLLPKPFSLPPEPCVDIPPRDLRDDGSSSRWTYLDLASGAADINRSSKTIHQWLWNRVASLRSALPLIDLGAIPPEYVSLTCFCWNENWDSSLRLHDIRGELHQLRSELLQQKTSYQTATPAKSLRGHAAADLLAKIQVILVACSRAREQSEIATQHGTAVACDHIWDDLVSSFLYGTSLNVRYLPAVALPRSAVADRRKDASWLSSARFTISQYTIYGSQHRDAALKLTNFGSTLVNQAVSAGLYLSLHPGLSTEGALGDTSEDVFEGVLSLVENDPVEAICDAVSTISIPNLVGRDSSAALRHAAERFRLLPHKSNQATLRARGGTAFYHGICDLPSEHSGLADAYDLFCANVRSAGLSPQIPGSLSLDVLPVPPATCRLSFKVPDSELEQFQVIHPPPLALDLPGGHDLADTHDSSAVEQSLALELPLLLVNHTPPEKLLAYIGSHKHRISATAGAAFLGAAGLSNVPVFSLITDGCRAVLTCAWAEKFGSFQRIKIAERNGVLFDLRNPLSVFHFATFLVRLKHEHGQVLRERCNDEALAHLRERLEQGEWETRWSMSHYVAEQSDGDI